MSEPEKKPEPELIPKTELEKVKTEAAAEVAGLKQAVEDAKLQLLSQEYLEFLEQKKLPKKKNEEKAKGESDEVTELKAQIAQMRAFQADLAAHVELENVRKVYKDFDEYKEEVQKVLENSRTDITIEQAYLIAKGQKPAEKTPEKKPEPSSEKPGGVYPPPSSSTKTFKTPHEAAMAAATDVLAKHGISGDTI